MSEEEEEEVVDPKAEVNEKCSKSLACTKLLVQYEKCAERIEEKGHGQCAGQYMDYIACVDNCSKMEVFAKLK